MDWNKFSEGASVGFDNFMDVTKGEKDIITAMQDIKDHFNKKRVKTKYNIKTKLYGAWFFNCVISILLKVLVTLPK